MTKRCKMLGATAGPASALKSVTGTVANNVRAYSRASGKFDFKKAAIFGV